jgi:pimeloyl-ACP methyl ester carboxylesterase
MRTARKLKATPKSVSYTVAHRRAKTDDGVSIAFTLWRRPSRELLILAPGFWRVRLARENLYLANHFLRRGYDVAALDFRGHGDSGGRYTFGESEPLDLKAVVDELVGRHGPYERFAVLGLSMGGSIAAEMLARWPELPADALAMISSPADVRSLRPRPWTPDAVRQVRLRHALKMPRLAGRPLFRPKPSAAEAVSRIAIPKLIVSSRGDWLVDPEQGRTLARSAAEPVEYVHLDIPGSLHADALVKFVPLRLLRLLDRWFARNAPP